MGKKVVIARLRPKKDDDIKTALETLPEYYDESDIVREALRLFFFGNNEIQPKNIVTYQSNLHKTLKQEEDVVVKKVDNIDEDELEGNLDSFIGIE